MRKRMTVGHLRRGRPGYDTLAILLHVEGGKPEAMSILEYCRRRPLSVVGRGAEGVKAELLQGRTLQRRYYEARRAVYFEGCDLEMMRSAMDDIITLNRI